MEATLQDPVRLAVQTPSVAWVVDLDGTLIRGDTLWESVVCAAIRQPLRLGATILAMRHGRQHFKRQVAAIVLPDPATLPYRTDLLTRLQLHRAQGGQLHLVTAADQSIADAVATQLELFDSATGSTPERNLKGATKAAFLRQRFPEGFVYIGDSRADLPVWQQAQGALLAGDAARLSEQVEACGTAVLAQFPDRATGWNAYWRLARIHQWLKNLLMFVPLLLGHALGRPAVVLHVALAFVAFSMVASSTYVFNDLADLAADRRHPTKRNRPLARGDIPVQHAVAIGSVLFLAGMTGCALLSASLAWCACLYVLVTVLYSSVLKQIALIDVAVIGGLFALRVIMGTFVAQVPYSDWLVSFSILFFCSLAFAKRHTELIKASAAGSTWIAGRGYRSAEWPLTLAFGVSLAVASLIVMLLYIRLEATQANLYSKPQWLIIAPLATLCWIMRVWLVSHRGELDDDPIIFAIRDRVSWALAAVVGVAILLAT